MKKNQRGLMGYVVLIAVFLVIAILLNGGLGQQENKRIEYPQLLTSIREDNVKAVAIRGTSLVGVTTTTTVADADFPDKNYDFETTIGADFIETVRQMTAAKTGKALEDVSVSDLPFTVEYRAPVVTPWYLEYLPYFLSLILIVGLWYFIMMRQGGGNSKVMNFGRSRARVSENGGDVQIAVLQFGKVKGVSKFTHGSWLLSFFRTKKDRNRPHGQLRSSWSCCVLVFLVGFADLSRGRLRPRPPFRPPFNAPPYNAPP